MFSLMYVWWIFFHQLGKYHWPTFKRYFQCTMNILSLEWSLGLFLYIMGNGTDCIAGQPRTHVYIHTQKGTSSLFCETHPKPAQSTQSVPIWTPCVTNSTTNLREGAGECEGVKYEYVCFLACKPLIENITCNPHRGRKTERDGQEWEAYIDHHSLTHTDR